MEAARASGSLTPPRCMNERRGAAPAPPPPGPPLAGGRRAQSAAATSAAFGPDGGSLPEARRPALTVLHARRRRSRRSRVSERARARAPRAVAPGLGLRGLGGSGFGMLRRPRARASLPHTLRALRPGAGRSGTQDQQRRGGGTGG